MKTEVNRMPTIATIIGVSTLTFLGVKYLSKNGNKLLDKLSKQVINFLDNAE